MFTVENNSCLKFKLGVDPIPKFLGFTPGSARPQWELEGIVFSTSSFFYSEKEKVLVLDIVKIGTVEVITENKPQSTPYYELSKATIIECMGKTDDQIIEICESAGMTDRKDFIIVCQASSVWDFVCKNNMQKNSIEEITLYADKMLGRITHDVLVCLCMFKLAFCYIPAVEVDDAEVAFKNYTNIPAETLLGFAALSRKEKLVECTRLGLSQPKSDADTIEEAFSLYRRCLHSSRGFSSLISISLVDLLDKLKTIHGIKRPLSDSILDCFVRIVNEDQFKGTGLRLITN